MQPTTTQQPTTPTERRFVAMVRGKPCSANRLWTRAKQGHLYLSDAAAAWEVAVAADVREQMNTTALLALWRAAGRPNLAVALTFYGVRGDVDNYSKATLDGLKQAIQIDDRSYAPVSLHRGERKRANGRIQPPGARIEITIPMPPVALITPVEPEAAITVEETPFTPPAPGSLRVIDLVDPDVLARLLPPVNEVGVWNLTDYDCVSFAFPPAPQAGHADEWGALLPLAQARQLRDALNALSVLAESHAAR